MVLIRTAYDDGYVDPGVQFVDRFGEFEVSLTVQSEKDNCDINLLMDRYQKSGILPVMQATPIFGDFTELPDYREAVEIVMKAKASFDSLDAKVRREFNNDPAEFLDFANNPDNADRMRDLGLMVPKVVESTSSVDSTLPADAAKA